jgi:hypothetical protein
MSIKILFPPLVKLTLPLWKLIDAGGGYCKISVKASDAAYINLKDGSATNGATVQIYTNGTNTK